MMNHWKHYRLKQGDFFMHSEPGGAFFTTSPEQASRMILTKINERFESNCGIGFASDDFLDCMRAQEQS